MSETLRCLEAFPEYFKPEDDVLWQRYFEVNPYNWEELRRFFKELLYREAFKARALVVLLTKDLRLLPETLVGCDTAPRLSPAELGPLSPALIRFLARLVCELVDKQRAWDDSMRNLQELLLHLLSTLTPDDEALGAAVFERLRLDGQSQFVDHLPYHTFRALIQDPAIPAMYKQKADERMRALILEEQKTRVAHDGPTVAYVEHVFMTILKDKSPGVTPLQMGQLQFISNVAPEMVRRFGSDWVIANTCKKVLATPDYPRPLLLHYMEQWVKGTDWISDPEAANTAHQLIAVFNDQREQVAGLLKKLEAGKYECARRAARIAFVAAERAKLDQLMR